MKKAFRGAATALAFFCCLAPAGGTALAQSAAASAAAASDPEYQALFKRMFANPQDMEATFRFAEVATRLGDYEAAIGALERVLFYNPDLARVKVELGKLYLRIGGTEVARSYFEQAIATPGASPEVQAAAQQLLSSGSTAGVAGGFNLYVNSGMRYQTNASAGPTGALILSSGDLTTLNKRFDKAPDWNYFNLTSAGYSHDLGNGIAAEFSFLGYYAKHLNLWRFDLGVVEVQAGPRIAIPNALLSDASIKLYGIGTASWLAEDPYYSGAGVGISSRFNVGDTRIEPAYEYRDRNFKNSEIYTTAAQQTGILHIAALNGDGNLFGLAWVGRISAGWNRTDSAAFDFNSYDRLSGDVGFPMPYSLNWWGREWQFVFTPTAGFSFTDYLRPNPTIHKTISREDREWRVGAALDMQVYGSWGIRTHVQYAETESNLPNFDLTNLSVSVGPTFRF
ncbi:MAG TPA: tetratricopeptide repeat protein [Xanthobacteraceae bacterium]|nr:tetratricopeptide repeat protein [Xanthobacteraceae bacterium]